MKNSIEIIDLIDVMLIHRKRALAVTTPEHKSYFEGRIAELTELRDLLLADCNEHHAATAAVIAKM